MEKRTSKPCVRCGEMKPVTDYYGWQTGRTWARCKPCVRENRRKPVAAFGHPCAWCGEPVPQSKHPGRKRKFCSQKCAVSENQASNPVRQRGYRFSQYGITEADHDAILKRQGGRCAICDTAEPASKSGAWHIDHDHDSGAVRGLLCTRCNIGIGQMQDDPERLRAAAEYIESSRTRAV